MIGSQWPLLVPMGITVFYPEMRASASIVAITVYGCII